MPLSDGNDVVFAFEPPARGVARAEIVGLDPDVRLRIMKDCSAEPIACSDDFGSIAAAVDNALHYLVVDGGFNGDVLLSLSLRAMCVAKRVLRLSASNSTSIWANAAPTWPVAACL